MEHDYKDTTVVKVDFDKGFFNVVAEQIDGDSVVLLSTRSWAEVKKILAVARDENDVPVRATPRAMNAVKKLMVP